MFAILFSWKIKSQFSVKKIVCKVQCIYSWKKCNFIHEIFFRQALIGFLAFGERLSLIWWSGTSLILIGTYVISSSEQHTVSHHQKSTIFGSRTVCLKDFLISVFNFFFNSVILNYAGRNQNCRRKTANLRPQICRQQILNGKWQ